MESINHAFIRVNEMVIREEYFRNIFDRVSEGILVLDANMRVLSANRSFLHNFKVDIENTLGSVLYDLQNGQWNIPDLRLLLEDIIPKNNTVDDYEIKHDLESIGQRTMLLNACKIKVKQNEPPVILLSIKDVTERRLLEEDRSKLAAVVASADDPIIGWDLEGTIVSWNSGAEGEYCYRAEEIIGKSIALLMPPGRHDEYKELSRMRLSGDIVKNYETQRRRKDGQMIDVSLTISPVKDLSGEIAGFSSIARNITEHKKIEAERKRVENDLYESQQLLRLVLNTIPVRLFWKDLALNYLGCNKIFASDAGLDSPEAIVGRSDFDMGWKEQANLYRADDQAVISSGTPKLNYEEQQTTPEESLIWLRTSKIPLLDAEGKIRGVLGTYEDITERKRIENALITAFAESNELAAELKHTARVKADFLASMSHALKTPLNSINGFSEVLYDETFGPLNEKQKKYVSYVLTSGKHLLLLINQILDMAKVEAGKMNLSFSRLPMKSLLNESIMLVADIAGKKKLGMSLEIADDLPDIEGDELKVKEIIHNLLANAIKFTPEGGKYGMRAKKADSEIEIVMWDTGIGIEPENMEKIFEGFFRIDTPYSQVTEGTGIGLPLSRKLVELHGGKLSVESKGLNKGTTIRLTLPIKCRMVA